MKCPVCSVDLVMADRSGVEIDYCPKCRGVWLDRGELDKIIERSVDVSQVRSAPPGIPQQGYPAGCGDSHYGHPYKRKKSWLGELFD
jgi:Zn-finger nucleic acid-binding protein